MCVRAACVRAQGMCRPLTRVWHAVFLQLPRRQCCTLIPRPRLSNPHVHVDTPVVSKVDGRRGRAIVHKCEPARVAMRQDVDRLAR
jgi:hypothetical protein